MKNMRLSFIPKSRSGKWAVGLGIASVVLTALSVFFAFTIGGNHDIIADNLLLTILSAALSIIWSLVCPLSLPFGIYAIIKHKDWSVCVSLAVLYVLTFLLFLLGEFLFPH